MALIVLGIVAGLATVGWRSGLERDFDQVELALDLQDLIDSTAPGTEALPLDTFLPRLHDWGVQSVVLTVPLDEPWDLKAIEQMGKAIRDAGFRVILKLGSDGDEMLLPGQIARQVPDTTVGPCSAADLASLISITEPQVVLAGGSQVPGYPDELPQVAELLRSGGIRFGLQEFARQAGAVELAKLAPLHTVRVHTIFPKELPRYDEPSARTRFIRAVRERSYRLLYVRAWPEDGSGTAAAATATLVKGIDMALETDGYVRGPASSLPPWQTGLGTFLLVLGGWLGASLMLWMALYRGALEGGLPRKMVHLANRLMLAGIGSLMALVLVCYIFYQEILARQILALLIAVTFPTWAVLPQRWSQGIRNQAARRGQALTLGLWQFAVATAISLTGALMIVAALGDYRFMLKIAEFRGVKAMSLLPMGFVGIGAFFQALQAGPSSNWRQRWHDTSIWLKGGLLLVAVAVATVYVGRTGNFVIPVPDWEVRLREFLETALPYRPRTKELFIGHPLLVLGFGLYGWGWRRLGLWIAVLGSVGQVSMVNTFTHIHSSLISAISRTFGGLLLGGLIGCVLLGLALRIFGNIHPRPTKTANLPPRGRPN